MNRVLPADLNVWPEEFDGARAARRAGVPAVVRTQHQPWLDSPRRQAAFFRAMAPVDRLIAVSEGVRLTHQCIGVPAERLVTVPNGIVSRDLARGGRPPERRWVCIPISWWS